MTEPSPEVDKPMAHRPANAESDPRPQPPPPPVFDKARHVRYWLRCLRTLLPTGYTSQDNIRPTLGFFIVSALDLLSRSSGSDESEPIIRPDEFESIHEWALSLQHPNGGFYGSPSTMLPTDPSKEATWAESEDKSGIRGACTPNLAATFFCLLLLAVAAPAIEGIEEPEKAALLKPGSGAFIGVRGKETMRWLCSLQREDGSFGEFVDGEGAIHGSKDMRYTYMAAAVRWMLRRGLEGEQDINVTGLKEFIVSAQTYDGGIAEDMNHEAHGGYGYCAISTMALLDRPLDGSPTPHNVVIKAFEDTASQLGCKFGRAELMRWLSYRQFDPVGTGEIDETETPMTAFNGRLNKDADSCYTWWATSALDMLGFAKLINPTSSRAFLLTHMQHSMAGGFMKYIGVPPDIYHSYLGLLSLSLLGSEDLKPADAAMSSSKDTVARVVAARESAWDDGVERLKAMFEEMQVAQ